jgi:hypothetical protein
VRLYLDLRVGVQGTEITGEGVLLLHCISNITGAVGQLLSEHAGIKREKSVTSPLARGFGGLGDACWPLVPKFAGSNAFLRRGSKAGAPMS